jgi:hypothetical protein
MSRSTDARPITEEAVLARLDRARTAMELSELFEGRAVWNYERVRARLLALEAKGLVARDEVGRRNVRWRRTAAAGRA